MEINRLVKSLSMLLPQRTSRLYYLDGAVIADIINSVAIRPFSVDLILFNDNHHQRTKLCLAGTIIIFLSQQLPLFAKEQKTEQSSGPKNSQKTRETEHDNLTPSLPRGSSPSNAPAKTDSASEPIRIADLARMLKSDGILGEIHGSDPDNRIFVLTYRDPKDFFNHIQIALASRDKGVIDFFQTMKRHDKVRVKGVFFHDGEFLPESPQPHIEVSSIEMVKQYQALAEASSKFKKNTVLPAELEGKTEAEFLVHANPKQGGILVLEYMDNLVFAVIPNNTFSENLYRNDRIRMRFRVLNFPTKPIHIELDTDTSGGKKPIEVLESIKAFHGKRRTEEGRLVRFPKSPQINRDIWAVEQPEMNGNTRTFTLVNFEEPGEQERIDAKLKSWWDSAAPDAVIDGRNKLVHKNVRIRASGIMNVVDPNQANAQMQLKAKDLSLLSRN